MRTVLTLCMLLLLVVFASAATIHVAPDGSGDQPDIAAAVAVAEPGDVIQLAPGVYTGDGNRDVVVDKELTIRGSMTAPEDYVIDCQGDAGSPHRGFWIDGAGDTMMSSTIEGVSIEWGYGPGSPSCGGAILVDDCSLVVNHCRFEHNRADRGGAIGIITPSGTAEFHDCWFQSNTAFDAGAAAFGVNISVLKFFWCSIFQNTGGGAFGSQLGYAYLSNCTVAANGGGAFLGYDEGWGGYSLDNCIVAHNGGPAFENNPDLSAYLTCTDIYGNDAGDWNSAPVAGQLGVDGNIHADPMFCDFWSGDLELDAASPCAPYSPPNEGCALIGAWPVGCGMVAVESRNWSAVKDLFR